MSPKSEHIELGPQTRIFRMGRVYGVVLGGRRDREVQALCHSYLFISEHNVKTSSIDYKTYASRYLPRVIREDPSLMCPKIFRGNGTKGEMFPDGLRSTSKLFRQ